MKHFLKWIIIKKFAPQIEQLIYIYIYIYDIIKYFWRIDSETKINKKVNIKKSIKSYLLNYKQLKFMKKSV